jgi:hypothetical protein
MRYTVQPGVGVGAIRFGMTVEEMHGRLGAPDEEGLWEETGERQDWWDSDGLSVLYDASGACVEIALIPPAIVRLDGRALLGVPDAEALAALQALDEDAVEEEDGVLVSAALGIALSRNDDGELEFLMLAPGRLDDDADEDRTDAHEPDGGAYADDQAGA